MTRPGLLQIHAQNRNQNFFLIENLLVHILVQLSRCQFPKTWCQILYTMQLQCVSKILTPRRMLQKTSLIAKINRWNNSFQNMYDMLQVKVDRFARKTFFSKKTPKKSLFWRTRFRGFLTLGGAVCQTIGPRSTIRLPLKTLEYNGSNQLLGMSVESKLCVYEHDTFF